MNTPAHVLIAVAVAGQPASKARNAALIVGALFPDLMLFVMVAWERWINGLSFDRVFGEAYYSDFWQQIFAVNNSAPVFATFLVLGLWLRAEWLWAFGLAALLHVICDLPLHHDDAHVHFWPFTDWVFTSPVSYWDPRHHGVVAGWIEAGLSLALAVILLRRFKSVIARTAIIVGLGIEWVFSVGGHLIYG